MHLYNDRINERNNERLIIKTLIERNISDWTDFHNQKRKYSKFLKCIHNKYFLPIFRLHYSSAARIFKLFKIYWYKEILNPHLEMKNMISDSGMMRVEYLNI